MKSVPAGYSGKQLPAELGLESGTREAFVSAAEYHPVLLEDVQMQSNLLHRRSLILECWPIT